MIKHLHFSTSLRRIEARQADQPLMQRAGQAAAEWAMDLLAEYAERAGNAIPGTTPAASARPVLILAGPGNNGGDALVVATVLRQHGYRLFVAFAGTPERLPPDARAAHAAFVQAGGITVDHIPADETWGLIVDGLFGIGLSRAPEGQAAAWIHQANQLARRDACPLFALDCPSGLDADRGTVAGPCIVATHTLTFISGKPGLLTADGPDHCGMTRLATLGIASDDDIAPDGRIVSLEDFASRLKPRRLNSHKGSYGGVGILGGSRSMSGAVLLAGRAALKLGAGRVYLGLLDTDGLAVDTVQPELMIRRADMLFQADLEAMVCGPGLGKSSDAVLFVEQALKCPLPLVLDADALNIIAVDGRLEGNLRNRVAPAVLTPHPAEAARLLGCSVRDIQQHRITASLELAQRYGSTVALKGCGTVIATVDGRWWINSTGNPGMASAGMGDVLSGLIAPLLAQNWAAEEALLAAVHLHGAAADQLVNEGIGPIGLTAGELIDAARRIFNDWSGTR